jgi:hypothetical protein
MSAIEMIAVKVIELRKELNLIDLADLTRVGWFEHLLDLFREDDSHDAVTDSSFYSHWEYILGLDRRILPKPLLDADMDTSRDGACKRLSPDVWLCLNRCTCFDVV